MAVAAAELTVDHPALAEAKQQADSVELPVADVLTLHSQALQALSVPVELAAM
jgi:hypothetical protein